MSVKFRKILYLNVLLLLLVVLSISFTVGQEVFEGLYGITQEDAPKTYEIDSSTLSTEGGKLQSGIYKTKEGKEYNVEKTTDGYVIDGIKISGKDVKYDGEKIEISGKGTINGVSVSGDKIYYSKDGGYRIEGSGKLNDVSVSNAKGIIINSDKSMTGISEKSCSVNGIQFKDEGTRFVYDPNKKEISPVCADKACNIAIDPKTLGKDQITISSANEYNLYSNDGKSSINVDGKINVDKDGNLILKGGYNEKDRFETTINGYKVSSRTDLKIDIRQNENVDQAKIDSLSKEKDPSKEYIPEETMVIFKDSVVIRSSIGTDVSIGEDSSKFMISNNGIIQFQKKDVNQKDQVNFIYGNIRYGSSIIYNNNGGDAVLDYPSIRSDKDMSEINGTTILAKGFKNSRNIIITEDNVYSEYVKSDIIDSKNQALVDKKKKGLERQKKEPSEKQKENLKIEIIKPEVDQAIRENVLDERQALIQAFSLAECTGDSKCPKSSNGNVGPFQIGPISAKETIEKNPEVFRKELDTYNLKDEKAIARLLEKDVGFAAKVCDSIAQDCEVNPCNGIGEMCVALCYKNGPSGARDLMKKKRISPASKEYLGKIDYVLSQTSKKDESTASLEKSDKIVASLI